MAEWREYIDKYRRGGNIDELIAAMTLMQGNLDTNSFIAGMLLGKGRRSDHNLALLLAFTAANNNAQQQQMQQGTGVPMTTNQNLLPLLLLLGSDWCDWDRSVEVIEKKPSSGKSTGT